MKDARVAYNKGDTKRAKELATSAYNDLKKIRKEAENIDDDGILETVIISLILSVFGPIGALANTIGYYVEWYTLRTQSDKSDTYSKTHLNRKKNLVLEWLFGKLRAAGYSRSLVLSGLDKMLDECKRIIDNIK